MINVVPCLNASADLSNAFNTRKRSERESLKNFFYTDYYRSFSFEQSMGTLLNLAGSKSFGCPTRVSVANGSKGSGCCSSTLRRRHNIRDYQTKNFTPVERKIFVEILSGLTRFDDNIYYLLLFSKHNRLFITVTFDSGQFGRSRRLKFLKY